MVSQTSSPDRLQISALSQSYMTEISSTVKWNNLLIEPNLTQYLFYTYVLCINYEK